MGVHPRGASAEARVRGAIDRLRATGHRRTIGRRLVLQTLAEADGHLAAADVHARLVDAHPTLNLSTVHRTLVTLADSGLIHVLAQPGQARYGLADQPHHHAVCAGCGRTSEVPAADLADLLPRLEEATGLVLAPGLTLTGYCPDCSTNRG